LPAVGVAHSSINIIGEVVNLSLAHAHPGFQVADFILYAGDVFIMFSLLSKKSSY
jgi:hypothetical protein